MTVKVFPMTVWSTILAATNFIREYRVGNLSVVLSVLGQTVFIPSKLPIVSQDGVTCLVGQQFSRSISVPSHSIDMDVSDCTSFLVEHVGQDGCDMSTAEACQIVFDRTVEAVSECILWMKSKDVIATHSAFSRQIGTLDVKVFMVSPNDHLLVLWRNPAYAFDRNALRVASQLVGGIVMTNGPIASPTHWVVRRVQSSLDLLNLGFFTDSFVTMFALADDLVQTVVKAGLSNRGLQAEKQQKSLLMAIKEKRLSHMLDPMMLVCGWKSLKDEHPDLFRELLKVNERRNNVMHGPERLTRSQALDDANTLLRLIHWLRGNPFSYVIPALPVLRPAFPEYELISLDTNP